MQRKECQPTKVTLIETFKKKKKEKKTAKNLTVVLFPWH